MRGTRSIFAQHDQTLIDCSLQRPNLQMSNFRKIVRRTDHDEVMMSDEETAVANNEHIDAAPDADLRRQLEEPRQEIANLQRG